MRTALRSWIGLVAVVALWGCGGDRPPVLNPDTGTRDSSLPDAGPPVDTGVPPVDAFRVDTGTTTGSCSYGGGCDLLSATSCPDMGTTRQACYPGMGSSMCYPAGSAIAGAACDSLNDCDTGLVCLGSGTCAVACCGNADCALGEMCQPLGDADGNPLPNGVGVCNRPTTCTPVPNSCPEGEQCYVTDADGTTDCLPTGTVTEGMECAGNCLVELGCYGATGATPTCTRFCRVGMDSDCGTGQTCADNLGGDMFGLCMGG